MGRGRAKAKQTKVARDLKYQSHDTDFNALAKELHGNSPETGPEDTGSAEESEDEDWTGYSSRE